MMHINDDQLILYHYKEADEADAIEEHLDQCEKCRSEYDRLQRVLTAVDSAPVPERSADYGTQVWDKLRPQIAKKPEAQRIAVFPVRRVVWVAAVAASLVLPELTGKMNGIALRVPVPNVSVVDLTCVLEKNTTKEEINSAFKNAAEGPLKGILAYTEDPVVSTDFNHSTSSATFDAQSTMVLGGSFVKVLAWYDNEWGFSCRMTELIELIGEKAGM